MSFRQSLVTLLAATSSDKEERLGRGFAGGLVGTAVGGIIFIFAVLANSEAGVIIGLIVGALVGALSSRHSDYSRFGRGKIVKGLIGGFVGSFIGLMAGLYVLGSVNMSTPGHIINVGLGLVFGVIVGMMFGFIVGDAISMFANVDRQGFTGLVIIAGAFIGAFIGLAIGETSNVLLYLLLGVMMGGAIGLGADMVFGFSTTSGTKQRP